MPYMRKHLEMDNKNNFVQEARQWMDEQGYTVAISIPSGDNKCSLPLVAKIKQMVTPSNIIFVNLISMFIDYNRNKAIADLQTDERLKNWTHVWFLDSDTVPISKWSLYKLLKADKDIISGIAAFKEFPTRWSAGYLAGTKTAWFTDISKTENPWDFEDDYKDKVVEIDICGSHCLLVKREVFEKTNPPWWNTVFKSNGINILGEDLYFCANMKQNFYKLYIHFGVPCFHFENKTPYPLMLRDGELTSAFPLKSDLEIVKL